MIQDISTDEFYKQGHLQNWIRFIRLLPFSGKLGFQTPQLIQSVPLSQVVHVWALTFIFL